MTEGGRKGASDGGREGEGEGGREGGTEMSPIWTCIQCDNCLHILEKFGGSCTGQGKFIVSS